MYLSAVDFGGTKSVGVQKLFVYFARYFPLIYMLPVSLVIRQTVLYVSSRFLKTFKNIMTNVFMSFQKSHVLKFLNIFLWLSVKSYMYTPFL